MATDWQPELTQEEIEKLAALDVADVQRRIEGIVEAMGQREDLDPLARIGSATFAMTTFMSPSLHVVVAAVAMEMLNQERKNRS